MCGRVSAVVSRWREWWGGGGEDVLDTWYLLQLVI